MKLCLFPCIAYAVLAACSSSNNQAGTTTSFNLTGGGTTGGVNTVARLRVAEFSPDSAAFDYCISPHGQNNYSGPFLKDASLPGGLHYPSVTVYRSVPVGQLDVRLVVAGSLNCNNRLSGNADLTNLPALAANSSYTLAATGKVNSSSGEPSFAVKLFTDEANGPATAGQTALRFLQLDPSKGNLDLGTGSDGDYVALFTKISFGVVPGSSDGSTINSNGYATTSALNQGTLTIRSSGFSIDTLVMSPITLLSGESYSLFALQNPTGYTSSPLTALLCADQTSDGNGFTSCVLYPVPLSILDAGNPTTSSSSSGGSTTTGSSGGGTTGGGTTGGASTAGTTGGATTGGTTGGNLLDGGSIPDGGVCSPGTIIGCVLGETCSTHGLCCSPALGPPGAACSVDCTCTSLNCQGGMCQ